MSDNMQTSLAKVRGLGSAKGGTRDFWRQRLTALANVPLTLFLLGMLATHITAPHATLVALIGQPLIGVSLLLLIISAYWHMCLGLQIVIEDYVHTPALKMTALILNQFVAITLAVIAVVSVLKLILS